MATPSLLEESNPDPSEPLDQTAGMVLGRRGVSAQRSRTRRLAGALAGSTALHVLSLIASIILVHRGLEQGPVHEAPPLEQTVPFTFDQPEPPAALSAPRPTAAPPAAAARPEPPPLRPAPEVAPPVGPLPEPNRMGERLPVPPPPTPSRGLPPEPETERGGARPPDERERGDPPPLGEPEATGEEPPGGERGSGTDAATGSPQAGGERTGSLVVPAPRPSGPGPSLPGPGGEGSREPGASRRPSRRGFDYGVPHDTGAFGNFSFEHSDYDWTDYWSVMYWAIWRAWHNHLHQGLAGFERAAYERGTAGLAGMSVLRFTIERNGNISLVELVTPSGIRELDQASRDALRSVILPPLPADFPHPRERVTGTFQMEVPDVRMWRSVMNQAKYRGVF